MIGSHFAHHRKNGGLYVWEFGIFNHSGSEKSQYKKGYRLRNSEGCF